MEWECMAYIPWDWALPPPRMMGAMTILRTPKTMVDAGEDDDFPEHRRRWSMPPRTMISGAMMMKLVSRRARRPLTSLENAAMTSR